MLFQAAVFPLLVSAVPTDVTEGRALFHDPGIGKNGVACSACHSTAPDEAKEGDGLIRAGHTIHGVAKRKHWRGDKKRSAHPTLSDAVDVCVQLFQGGTPLAGRARLAIDAYLRSVSPAPQEALTIVPALEADLDYDREKYHGGDAGAGRGLFFRACSGCHPKAGSGLGPSIRGKKASDVVRKVREGNGLVRGSRKGTEWMPFFGSDRLNDKQLADIAAYVSTLEK